MCTAYYAHGIYAIYDWCLYIFGEISKGKKIATGSCTDG